VGTQKSGLYVRKLPLEEDEDEKFMIIVYLLKNSVRVWYRLAYFPMKLPYFRRVPLQYIVYFNL
jgi:hypothetical protein